MATKKKRTIYVSSTFEDLEEHRAAVKTELERAGYDVESMERYAAFAEPPLDHCLADVAACDGYVLVLAHRYGFQPKGADGKPGRSITHREYEQAVSPPRKPVFAFCVDEEEPWKRRFMDQGDAARELAAFRQTIETTHGRRLFTTPDNLAAQVLAALSAHSWEDAPAEPVPAAPASYRWPTPWDFEPFMRDKRRSFEGREWLFAEIDAWLAAPAAPGSGALLIRADFGVGKSALLAEVVARHRGREVVAWHFCQHDTQATLQPGTFVASLAARLAEALPAYRRIVEADPALQERLDRAAVDPGSALAAVVIAPLLKIAVPEGSLLLVVDALDEALELDAADARRSGTLVRLLADKVRLFPPWLRVLATSRSNPDVVTPLEQACGPNGLKKLDAERQDNVDDLRRYVLARAAGPALAPRLQGSGHTAETLADLLVAKSAGKFLFVVRALDGLERGALALDELAALPPGMDAFYRDAFERRFDRAGRDYAATRDLFGVMCAAREPLSRPELAEVLGVTAAVVQELHRALPDFLRLRSDRLGFDHFSLAEWLTREDDEGFRHAGVFAVDTEAAQVRLREWALARVRARTAHTCPYLLRHLAAHLAEDQRGAIYAELMLERFEWSQARLDASGVEALLADTEHLQGHVEQGWLQAAMRNSAYVLRQAPDQWPARVLGLVGQGLGPHAALRTLALAGQQWLSGRAGRLVARRLLVPVRRSLRLSTAYEATYHGGSRALAVLPDGRIALSLDDCTVRLWNPARPGETIVFEGHSATVTALAVLPDGRIASGSWDNTVRLWNPARPAETVVFEGHSDGVRVLVVLPDGRIASGSNDHTVRLWNPARPAEALVFEGHLGSVTALVVLPDGRIASGSDDYFDCTVRLWNLVCPAEAVVFEGHSGSGGRALDTGSVRALAVLPDGRIASGSVDRTVRLWKPARLAEAVVFEGHSDWVNVLAVLPDGRIASGSKDRTVRLWNPAHPAETIVFEGHSGWVTALAVLLDGRIASGSEDRTVRLWNPARPAEVVAFEGHSGRVTALAVLPDGRIASSSDNTDGTVQLWNPARPAEDIVFEGHSGKVTALAVLPDGRIASISDDDPDCTVRLWNPARPAETVVFEGHSDKVTALAVLPDGRIASGSKDRTVRLWNPARPAETLVFEGHSNWITALAVLPDGRIASAAGGSTVLLWNPACPTEVVAFEENWGRPDMRAVLPDGRIASAAGGGTVLLWNPACPAEDVIFEGHRGPTDVLVVLPDGRIALSSDDCTVQLWNPARPAETVVFKGHSDQVVALAVLPDGRIASGSWDNTVRLWNPARPAETVVFEEHSGCVNTLAVLSDGRIASGSRDCTVRVWDEETRCTARLFIADAGVTCLAAAFTVGIVAAGCADGAVHLLRDGDRI